MSAQDRDDALVLALPSKGRLQEPAFQFFADIGLPVIQGSGREYSASIKELPGARIVLTAASEIPERLFSGDVHAGITGEDVIAEETGALPGSADEAAQPFAALRLGFGRARLVVAVPSAWIDVTRMADLADVARDMFRRTRRRLRVATKYERLTRSFFAQSRLRDYRIVPSAGATEAAPATGLADIIVDITTTGATLAANHLKTLSDGEMLASQASLFVTPSARAPFGPRALAALREIIDRADARRAAKGLSVIDAALPAADTAKTEETALMSGHRKKLEALGCTGIEAFTRVMGSARGETNPMIKLRAECPDARIYAVAHYLTSNGAQEVRVQALDAVYRAQGTTFPGVLRRITGR